MTSAPAGSAGGGGEEVLYAMVYRLPALQRVRRQADGGQIANRPRVHNAVWEFT